MAALIRSQAVGRTVVVIATNGRVDETAAERAAAIAQLKAVSSHVHAISFSNLPQDTLLPTLAQYSDCTCRIYQLPAFPQLIRNLGRDICGLDRDSRASQPRPISTRGHSHGGSCDLGAGVDILLILDTSRGQTAEELEVGKKAALSLLRTLPLESGLIHVAVASFSDASQIHLSFTDQRGLLEQAVASVGWHGGPAQVFSLEDALSSFYASEGNADHRLIPVILTNGRLEDAGAPAHLAILLSSLGGGEKKDVWAFGLGRPLASNLLVISDCNCRIGDAQQTQDMAQRILSSICPSGGARNLRKRHTCFAVGKERRSLRFENPLSLS